MRRLRALAMKEWRAIARRDLVYLVVIQPLIFCVVFGFCASLDLREVSLVVLDQSMTPQSRDVTRALEQSGRFTVGRRAASLADVDRALVTGAAGAALVIPPTFATSLRRARGGALAMMFDGTDPIVSTTGVAYAVASVAAAIAAAPAPPSMRAWYNSGLRSVELLLIATLCYNLMFFAVYPAQSLLDERDAGTLIPLSASPVSTVELWLGMIVPNGIVALWGTLVQIAAMIFIADVPFRGDPALLLGTLALFTFIHLNLGCVMAWVAGAVNRLTVLNVVVSLVFMAFSGFLMPLSYLSGWARALSQWVPMTHGLIAVRAIYEKGVGIGDIAGPLQMLALAGLVTAGLALAAVHRLLHGNRG